jgi:hypothetical protein
VTPLDLEAWDPLQPSEVAAVLAGCSAPWWIAGGYAIDAFVGTSDRRPHEDIDVGLLTRDQTVVRAHLAGWEAWCADPPGTLRPWLLGEHLEEPIHDVWLRPEATAPWRLALVLNPAEEDDWVYRRDSRVRRPLGELVWHAGGIPYLAAEVQLLFKAKTVRAKDERDFEDALPLLDAAQRGWLRRALEVAHPGHAWLARL